MIRTTLSILSLAVALGACSSGSGSSGDSGSGPGGSMPPSGGGGGDEPIPGTPIEGVWELPCEPGSDGRFGDAVLSITERVFELNENAYGDAGCTNLLSVLTTRGLLEEQIVEDGRRPEDGIPLDFVVEDITLQPLLSPVADSYNQLMLCGMSGWLPEQIRDVSSGCPQIDVPAAPRTDYNRYVVDEGSDPDERSDDTLLLGTLGAQPDELRRPEAIGSTVVLTRRPG